jgi:hypothetical protein
MADLSTRSAKLATILGKVSLALIAFSVLAVLAAFRAGFGALILAPLFAIVALTCAVAGMILRRSCLNPRPVSPPLALLSSLAACCMYAYWAVTLFSLGHMH